MSHTPPTADQIVSRVRGAAEEFLRRGRTKLHVLQIATAGIAAVEQASDASPQKAQRACRAGCSACCHLMVSITPPEAFLIADRLQASRSAAEFAAARAKIAATAERVEHLTIEQRAQVRIPCALLSPDGACSIHEFRPLGCRGWTSFSKDDCDTALRDARPGHDGPQDSVLYFAAAAASEAMGGAARSASVDAGNYEFHGALRRATETPDGATRWAAGEAVFAGCGRVRSERLLGG